MNAEEIARAEALPEDTGSLLQMVRALAREVLALRAELKSLRLAVIRDASPDHR